MITIATSEDIERLERAAALFRLRAPSQANGPAWIDEDPEEDHSARVADGYA